ncbi:34312_t:CDS:2 [Gigaspora margarita]|uniref:34312_t:CDS:1 n=1 Tax=Gigaspora margarita TaxID=4874 RepID=A0ABN7VI05_GIGMA|nr:34312_t:CDS:2 [Gigaspora margarita]
MSNSMEENEENFLWTKTCDAHTHAHDDRERLSEIGEVKTARLCLMGTRFEDLDIVSQLNAKFQSKVVPCFGFHPWFTHLLSLEDDPPENEIHYRSVLNDIGPKNSKDCNIEPLLTFLPPPKPFNVWFDKLENLVKINTTALIGEVGLDRSARLTDPKTKSLSKVQTKIQHQIAILEKQLDLAAKYNRAVSLHCVQATGQIIDLLDRKVLSKQPLPPRICMHSFGGSVDTIKRLTETQPKKKKKLTTDVYFSFSIVINERYSRLHDLIRAVPENKLLIESDFHSPDGLDHLMEKIVLLVSEAKGWTRATTIEKTFQNFLKFIGEA